MECRYRELLGMLNAKETGKIKLRPFGSLAHLHLYFYLHIFYHHLSNSRYRPHFLGVYRRDNPRRMLGEHEKSLYLRAEGD